MFFVITFITHSLKQVRSFKIPKSKADVDKLLKTSMNNKVGPIRPKKLLNFCAESLTILLKFSKKRKKKRKRSLKN